MEVWSVVIVFELGVVKTQTYTLDKYNTQHDNVQTSIKPWDNENIDSGSGMLNIFKVGGFS